jgi:ketosteroid isomerase-like protein
MKNKILKVITVCLILAIASSCNKKEEAPAVVVDNDQIKTELQAMETAFADAVNARKPGEVVYYADDATSYGQNKPPQVGKAAIDKAMEEDNATMSAGDKVVYTANEVFPSSDGNQVVEFGSYVVTDSTNTTKHSGNYMSLFQKKDGKNVCVRDMSASVMQLPKK